MGFLQASGSPPVLRKQSLAQRRYPSIHGAPYKDPSPTVRSASIAEDSEEQPYKKVGFGVVKVAEPTESEPVPRLCSVPSWQPSG